MVNAPQCLHLYGLCVCVYVCVYGSRNDCWLDWLAETMLDGVPYKYS